MVSGNLVMLKARVYKRDPWVKVGVPRLVFRLWPANKRLFTRAKRRGRKARRNLIVEFQSGNATGRGLTRFLFRCAYTQMESR